MKHCPILLARIIFITYLQCMTFSQEKLPFMCLQGTTPVLSFKPLLLQFWFAAWVGGGQGGWGQVIPWPMVNNIFKIYRAPCTVHRTDFNGTFVCTALTSVWQSYFAINWGEQGGRGVDERQYFRTESSSHVWSQQAGGKLPNGHFNHRMSSDPAYACREHQIIWNNVTQYWRVAHKLK